MIKKMKLEKHPLVYLAVILLLSVSCGQQSKSEKTGVDEKASMGEKVGKSIDNAANKTGEKLEDIKEGTIEKAEQTKEYIDDSLITSKIKAKILADPLLKVLQIKVTTTDGAVRVTGEVDSKLGISRTLEIANSVDGVKSVIMELTIKKKD